MGEKKIDGTVAHNLIEAAGHLAKLEIEMRDINWRICYRADLYLRFDLAKSHCRKLLKALDSAEHWQSVENVEKRKAEEPIIRQVK